MTEREGTKTYGNCFVVSDGEQMISEGGPVSPPSFLPQDLIRPLPAPQPQEAVEKTQEPK